MSKAVLDASVILAVLGQERGTEVVLRLLGDTAVSTVNLAEVLGKLMSRGVPERDAWEGASSLATEVVDFDREQARLVGALAPETKALGLSLCDRACLALGILLKLPVYTTEQAWKNLKVGVRVHVIR